MRSGNQIAALTEIREALESNEFQAARRYVFEELPKRLDDPAVRKQFYENPLPSEFTALSRVGNLFENLGAFVRSGIIDRDIACNVWSDVIIYTWNKLTPFLAMRRRVYGKELWENFEYLTVLAVDWQVKYPDGRFPRTMRRLPLDEKWVRIDEAAGIVPAERNL
jgi:hypothetical protein